MFVLIYFVILCTVFLVSRAENNIDSSKFPQRRLDRYQYHPLLEHCRDKGEAYSASFLVRKDFFLKTLERLILGRTGSIHGENTTRLYQGEAWLQRRKTLLKNANVELATFAMMSHVTDMLLNESGADYEGGRIYQSIDFLDFSVLHLSTYERLLHRYCEHEKVKQAYEDYSPIEEATEFLKQKGIYRSQGHKNHQSQQYVHRKASNTNDAPNYFHQTLVVMPYLGYTQGEGNSKIIYRQRYLAACFWSFFAYYPHIVIAVTSEVDRDYILSHSGLPVFDVLFLPGLSTPAALPLASVVATARKMSTYGDGNKPFPTPTEEYQDDVPRLSNNAKKAKRRVWKQQFEYVFYTESDQMLVMKSEERMMHLYKAIDKDPTRRWDQDFMLAPHRLTVYPETVLSNIYKFPSPYLASTKDVQLQQQHFNMNLSSSLPFLPVKTKDGQEISSTSPVLSSFASDKTVTGYDNKQKKKQDKKEKNEHEKPKAKNTVVSWQCCQPPSQMCRRAREEWSPLTSKSLQFPLKSHLDPGKVPSPQLISIFHPRLYVALGNVDFHYEQFHSCRLTQQSVSHHHKNELETCPNV